MIIRRLELLSKLVIDGVWPTGALHAASPVEDNDDMIIDDDFSPDRFKVKRVCICRRKCSSIVIATN